MKTYQTQSSSFSVRGSICTPAFPTPLSATTFPLSVFCFLLLLGNASAATRYVWQGSPSPAPPYTSWASAAHVIQEAVDTAQTGDSVLVAGGVYATGGRAVYGSMTNQVAIDRAITVESLMGPEVTIIQGYQLPGTTNGPAAVRCVYLANGALLAGFTLTNGATQTSGNWYTDQSGGGVWCETSSAVVSNCVLTGNSASSSGGGAYSGTLNNCTLTANSAWVGGGACESTLNNCTLTGNSASGGGSESSARSTTAWDWQFAVRGGACAWHAQQLHADGQFGSYGGGACVCTLNNCIVYYNTSGGNYSRCTFNYCCTTPLPAGGAGNTSAEPLIVDTNGWSNLRLQASSSCINAGNNAFAPGLTDLDGRPRIGGGTVDMGAYEVQPGVSGLFIGWLQQYGLPTDGSADYLDTDYDGHNNWQEWRCQTDPTSPLSVLRLLSASPAGTNVTVAWQSVAGVTYFLERSTNLWASPPFSLLAPDLPGQPGTTTYTDTNAASVTPVFYRVGVAN